MAGLTQLAASDLEVSPTAHLEVRGVSKTYGPIRALTGVHVSIAAGTIHSLVGENGAGKSTLGKIISGSVGPDDGQLLLDGQILRLANPREAQEHGIAAVAQELAVVSGLTVAQNVFLGSEPRQLGFVRRRRLRQRYDELSESVGFRLDPGAPAGSLRVAEKQQIEIMRALSRDARLLVLDEPSAALSGVETERLHALIRSLAAAGTTILLVSHFLEEVLDLSDTVTILRDGQVVRTVPAHQETRNSLIHGMLGRSLAGSFPERHPAAAEAATVLRVEELSAPGIQDVSFELRAGEIVGVAGLVGSGRTELARALVGAHRRTSGNVTVFGADGAKPLSSNPAQACADGVVMIAESRKEQGLVMLRSAAENVTLPRLGSMSTMGVVRRSRERVTAADLLGQVGVRAGASEEPVSALSGGNQQKVLIARALGCQPRVLIADEPTRGIDVGAKRAIYDILVGLAQAGTAVLVISNELEEVLALSERVLVMRAGRLAADLRGPECSQAAVLTAYFASTPEGNSA